MSQGAFAACELYQEVMNTTPAKGKKPPTADEIVGGEITPETLAWLLGKKGSFHDKAKPGEMNRTKRILSPGRR